MFQMNLGGDWTLIRKARSERYPATVPGCFHTDLLRAGAISDPFYRTNEKELLPLMRETWIYEREFTVTAANLAEGDAKLVFEGLDTLSTVELNGKILGETNNMFRRWEYAVAGVVKAGKNKLRVTFHSPLPLIEKRHAERHLHSWGGPLEVPGRAYVRKMPCSFGWDWGPVTVTAGIWKPVRLEVCGHARIADFHIAQHHAGSGATLDVTTMATSQPGARSVRLDVEIDGRRVASVETPIRDGRAVASLAITKPELWWPAGMGAQPLYTVRAELLGAQGSVLDATSRRIGLRELKLDRHPDEFGESFQFTCNGRPFFAKGANWIPADALITRLTEDDYRSLIQAARDANMNMLRAWGGGFYENDIFYDICDELGICVWQDFVFGCSMYPTFDKEWMENVRVEARENVQRIRHHACLALWCGNNELEQGLVNDDWTNFTMDWKEYGSLFDVLLKEVVNELDPQRDYWPSSPHTPHGDRKNHRDESCGDAHLWDVWHMKQPFEWYRSTKHRFISEFGFQSFPEPLTTRAFTAPDDRHVASTVMEAHQRSGIGNTLIMSYLLDWFRLPNTFDNTLHVTQILQAMAIKYAVEHWRRMMPRTMGTLYWQHNDTWPGNSWSSLDYFHRWKGLHYYARRFFAPVLLSLVEDANSATVECHITSDLPTSGPATLEWKALTASGHVVEEGSREIRVPKETSKMVHRIKLGTVAPNGSLSHTLVMAWLKVGGDVISENLAHFARPKNLTLHDPKLRVRAKTTDKSGKNFTVKIAATKPALYVFAELGDVDAKWSDRYFHLVPGHDAELSVTVPKAMTLEAFTGLLTVKSLYDTFEHVEGKRTAPAAGNGAKSSPRKLPA